MLLTNNTRYSCNIRLNMFQSLASNDKVVDYLKEELPKQGILFSELTCEGPGKIRSVTGLYVGETKDIELDERLSNVREITNK